MEETCLSDNGSMGKKMGRVSISLLTEITTKAASTKECVMEKETINGKTGALTPESGFKIKWKDMENTRIILESYLRAASKTGIFPTSSPLTKKMIIFGRILLPPIDKFQYRLFLYSVNLFYLSLNREITSFSICRSIPRKIPN